MRKCTSVFYLSLLIGGMPSGHHRSLDDCRQLATDQGGRCLSTHYIDGSTLMDWKCHVDHHPVFCLTADSVTAHNWCHQCSLASSRVKKATVVWVRLQTRVASQGGRCLSTYSTELTTKSKVRVQCRVSHPPWEAVVNKLLHSLKPTWCPQCANETKRTEYRTPLAAAQALAESLGGRCLSTVFAERMLWECGSCLHQWETTYNSVQQKKWCPGICKSKKIGDGRRNSLQVCHDAAATHGGQCLSTEYSTATVPLNWKCVQGHTFTLGYKRVQGGAWCPICKES